VLAEPVGSFDVEAGGHFNELADVKLLEFGKMHEC